MPAVCFWSATSQKFFTFTQILPFLYLAPCTKLIFEIFNIEQSRNQTGLQWSCVEIKSWDFEQVFSSNINRGHRTWFHSSTTDPGKTLNSQWDTVDFYSYKKVSEVIIIDRHVVFHELSEAEKQISCKTDSSWDFLSYSGQIRKTMIDNSLLEIWHFESADCSSLGRSMNLQLFSTIGMHKNLFFKED